MNGVERNIEDELARWAQLLGQQVAAKPARRHHSRRTRRGAAALLSAAAVSGTVMVLAATAGRSDERGSSSVQAPAPVPSSTQWPASTEALDESGSDAPPGGSAAGLVLSSLSVTAATAVVVYAVPMNGDSGTTVRVEALEGDDWTTVDVAIGPDILLRQGLVTPLRIPPLDSGTYRITLGDQASALVTVCDCVTDPVPTEAFAVDAVPAVIDDRTATMAFESSGLPLTDVRVTDVSVWGDGGWTAAGGVPPDGLVGEDVPEFLREFSSGTFRLTIEGLSVEDGTAETIALRR